MKSYRNVSISLFILVVAILCLQYVPVLSGLHGHSDAPFIVGGIALLCLGVSYVLKYHLIQIFLSMGYIVSFVLGLLLETKGVTYEATIIFELWIVWLIGLLVFVGILCITEALRHQASKKKSRVTFIMGIVLIVLPIYVLMMRPLTMDQVIDHKPHFTGTVLEVYENSLLIEIDGHDPMAVNMDLAVVSMDVMMDDMKVTSDDFKVNDTVTVYFNGVVLESYPVQINGVYAIFVD